MVSELGVPSAGSRPRMSPHPLGRVQTIINVVIDNGLLCYHVSGRVCFFWATRFLFSFFLIFSFLCRALDQARHLISFWAHANKLYRIVSLSVTPSALTQPAKTLVHALVSSGRDYCNSLHLELSACIPLSLVITFDRHWDADLSSWLDQRIWGLLFVLLNNVLIVIVHAVHLTDLARSEFVCRLQLSTPTIAIYCYYYSAQKLILILPTQRTHAG